MKTNLIISALFLFLLNSVLYTQWVVCPGSSEISGLGPFPVISVANQLTTVVAGGTAGAPKVFMTTNGGNNFVNITGNLSGPELYAVCVKNNNLIFVGDGGSNGGAGGNAKIWKTTNMGVNWVNILTTGGTAGFINGIRMTQYNNAGLIVSDGPTGSGILVYKTTDGGNNWTSQNVNIGGFSTATIGSLFMLNDQTYGFGANGINRITYTTNGGSVWNNMTIPLTGTSILVDCNQGMNCVAVSNISLPSIYKFVLGTAGSVINTGAGSSTPIGLRMMNDGWDFTLLGLPTGSNPIYRASNYGSNWIQMTTSSVTGITSLDCNITGTYFITGMAVSSSGTVIKYSSIVPGIILTNDPIPATYKLEQNYPNPFNPVTNINYSIPIQGFVSLRIYNTLGKLVSTLVDEEQNAGNYSVDLDAGEFASGIYYYTISSGNFRETKKMILIK